MNYRANSIQRSIPSRQRGAALVVGMLLLLVLTVLAISGMGSAALESIMAGNEQYKQNAFQAAEAGIADRYVNGDFNPSNLTPVKVGPLPVPGSTTGDEYETTLTVMYSGAHVQCPGNDVALSASAGGGGCFGWEIDSFAHSLRNSTAHNLQGMRTLGSGSSSSISQGVGLVAAFN